MGLFTQDIKTLEDLFSHGLKDIYYAENQILKALPKLIESATNPQLKKGLRTTSKTEEQVCGSSRFEMREEKPRAPNARASTASSRKATSSPATSPTRRCWMPPSSPPRRPSSTTKSRATEP